MSGGVLRTDAGPAPGGGRRIDILGVAFDPVDLDGAVARVIAFVDGGRPSLVVTANTEMVMTARRDAGLAALLAGAALVVADGVGVVWGSRYLQRPLPARVPGIELAERLLAAAARRRWRVYLLGGRPGIAEEAAARLRAAYPGLDVVGCAHGYFGSADEPRVVAAIGAAGPVLLLAGLGTPRQERWLARHLSALGVPVAMGIGGSLDVWAGRASRAPRLMQALGLEWLYRLAHEPRRLRRQLTIPHFMAVVAGKRAREARAARRAPSAAPPPEVPRKTQELPPR
ncbi:MAG TPA: WecB/TagA/CpsF family glycosyltransferase [bacterium]|nr:WecB/TagA/CpsF family glycosyltransferase [bacterium]